MKVIKIEIHEMPNSFQEPYLEMIKYPKIKPQIMSELDTIDYKDTNVVTKELYPLNGLALGEYQDWFYIREKDKKALENILNGFINKAKLDLLESIIDIGNKEPERVWTFIGQLKKQEEKTDENQ